MHTGLSDASYFTGTSGVDGKIVFLDVPSGEYVLAYEVDMTKYVPALDPAMPGLYRVPVSVEDSDVELIIELMPLPTLTVTVINAVTGDPIPNMGIRLSHTGKVVFVNVTDSNGQASIVCYPTRYTVEVGDGMKHYFTYTEHFDMPEHDTELQIELYPKPENVVPEVPFGVISASLAMVFGFVCFLFASYLFTCWCSRFLVF